MAGCSPGVPAGRGAVSGCGDPGEAAAADTPITSSTLRATRLLPQDLRGFLHSHVHLTQPVRLSRARYTGATPPHPTVQPEQGDEGEPGGIGVCVVSLGSPGDTGQWGHQAGEVEGPGASIAADKLATITAHRTLVLVLLPRGRGSRQGVTTTSPLGGTGRQPWLWQGTPSPTAPLPSTHTNPSQGRGAWSPVTPIS